MTFKQPTRLRHRLTVAVLLSAFTAGAAGQVGYGRWEFDTRLPPEPKWALELKSGDFEQELAGWDDLYGGDDTGHDAFAFGYKPLRAVEVGLEVGRLKNNGTGEIPLAGAPDGDFQYEVRPVHLYVLLRMVYGEDQGAVPYFGGGKTRLSYELSADGEQVLDDEVDGSHWRAGLQFLLDSADEATAADARRDMGIKNSYIFVEKQHIDAEVGGVQIGGDTFFIGLMFEW